MGEFNSEPCECICCIYSWKLSRGKNFRELVKVEHFANKTSVDCRLHIIAMVPPAQKLAGKTFVEGSNTTKFVKIFTCKVSSYTKTIVMCAWKYVFYICQQKLQETKLYTTNNKQQYTSRSQQVITTLTSLPLSFGGFGLSGGEGFLLLGTELEATFS